MKWPQVWIVCYKPDGKYSVVSKRMTMAEAQHEMTERLKVIKANGGLIRGNWREYEHEGCTFRVVDLRTETCNFRHNRQRWT